MKNRILSIKLSNDFKKEIIYNALCGGLGQLQSYGLELLWNDEDYLEAEKSYYKRIDKISKPCYEDILMELITMKKKVVFENTETGESFEFNLENALVNLDNLPTWTVKEIIWEYDDANTYDVVLQYCLFNEIIFG